MNLSLINVFALDVPAEDLGYGIAFTSDGKVVVSGLTDSTSFPKENEYQRNNRGEFDVFVTKFNFSLDELSGSAGIGLPTFLGIIFVTFSVIAFKNHKRNKKE